MSDNKLFDDPQTTPEGDANAQPQPATLVLPDPLKDLVGEGKKYASVEKALESIPHAQAHIQKLEQELKELREAVAKARGVDEVYNTVQDLLKQETATPVPAVVDEDSLAAILDRKLAEREAAKRAQANREAVKKALVEKYGEKAKEAYESRLKELGLGEQFVDSLIAHSPAAALELFGLKGSTPKAPAPSLSSVNTAALNSTPKEQPVKTVMGGATTQEIIAAWRAAAPKTN